MFTIKAVEEGLVPPTVNLQEAEKSALDLIASKHQVWTTTERRIALKNAFGFGRTNACLCIAQFIE